MTYKVGDMIVLWRRRLSPYDPGVVRGFCLVLEVLKQTDWCTAYSCLSSLTVKPHVIRLNRNGESVFWEL